jgi:aspartyl-tRNA(Asn)/glutamyl-tRNA(Gln) amidotransferase subunit B
MPKAYQISQYDEPINIDGWLDLPDGFRVGIERGHLEEDTGKSTHVGGAGGRIHGSDYSLIDFNRAGVPLVEIVSRPDIRHPEQAKGYINELREILVAVGASDAKMEEGSMRVDANVSVRKPGENFNTRCEIKNVNSVRSLGRAIEYEARRQIALHEADEPVVQQWIERVRDALPVLPAERRAILADAAGQAANSEAVMVVAERGQDNYVMDVAKLGGDAGVALKHVKEAPELAEQVPVESVATLSKMELSGVITASQAKTIVAVMMTRPLLVNPKRGRSSAQARVRRWGHWSVPL